MEFRDFRCVPITSFEFGHFRMRAEHAERVKGEVPRSKPHPAYEKIQARFSGRLLYFIAAAH
jgi:hypothetical protein